MISRRELITGAVSSLLLSKASKAQDQDWQKALEEYLNNNDEVTLGHIVPPPDDKSWKEAHDILSKAPVNATPYRIAEYFVSSVPEKYQRSWPEPDLSHPTYANPVILLFFVATSLKPAGDTTAWCAAFANWCLQHAGIPGTKCARSQSFKEWGRSVWSKADGGMPTNAKIGDIAVFRKLSKPGYGHVCFFKQISTKQPKSIEVIGGNQIHGKEPNRIHLIDMVSMRVDGDLELYTIRTQEGLRNE
jgi:uncharacterized protein (TIGR02594 family)